MSVRVPKWRQVLSGLAAAKKSIFFLLKGDLTDADESEAV